MNEEDNDKYIFNVKTVQSGAFRILIESLKEILTDTNFIFDQSGIKLIATDNSQIVLIHMKLHSENFEYFTKIVCRSWNNCRFYHYYRITIII